MDWLEERLEKTAEYIRNLSFRKAMVAYILVLSVIVYVLSYLTMVLCWQWELSEWAKNEGEDLRNLIYMKGPLWAYGYTFDITRFGDGQKMVVVFGFCAGVVSFFLRICRDDRDYIYFLSQAAGFAP